MVSGGFGTSYLDNTEVFKDGVWTTVSGKLPTGIGYHRATTISGNKVLMFGKYYRFSKIKWISLYYETF